jgi:RNA recognition motif-containing protein
MNIYVGNLAREVSADDLKQEFSAFGEVSTASVIKDKFTGEARGFGFVEMPSKEHGQAAITALNGKDLKGKAITVNEARPKSDNQGGGHGKGGFGGSRGGYGREGSGGGGKRKGSWGGSGW